MKKTIYNLLSKRHFKQSTRALQNLESRLATPQMRMTIPFIFKGKGHFKSIECKQNQSEIGKLFEIICNFKPKTVLELGTAKGGSLYLWAQAADPKATIVSVDLPEGEFGGGYSAHRIPFYHSFAKPGQKLHLFRDDSHNPSTQQKVHQLLKGEKVDFLFIDADHTYEGVKKDFELYASLVRSGGIIALHDILPRGDIPQIQVNRFWKEIKSRYETTELIGDEGSGRKIGIGLIVWK